MRRALALALLLAGCDRSPSAPPAEQGGAALEATARARGLVAATVRPVGMFQTDSDRVCLLPGRDDVVIGASVDYGEGQRCVARGRATGNDRLAVDFGGDCRFEARLDADRLTFPAVLPEACASACVGRASLSALSAARLSASAAEASRTRGADGALLCTG